jgi:ABC-2 type transport system permease protein
VRLGRAESKMRGIGGGRKNGHMLKTYSAIFRIRFIHGFQYRISAFSHMFLGFAWGLMLALAFAAFYRANPEKFPMGLSQAVSYAWLQQILHILFSVVVWEYDETESALEEGTVAYELIRPVGLYGRWFSRVCAGRTAPALLNLPVLVFAFLLPAPYGISPPPDAFQSVMFIISTVLALFFTAAITMLMYVTMFHTISISGTKMAVSMFAGFFAGGIVPLPFFPEPLRTVCELLPFAAMQNIPLRIYSGNIAGTDAFKGVIFQIMWMVALIVIGKATMGKALKKVTIQGG